MDTSNSIFETKDFTIADLLQSDEEADVALAKRASKAIENILLRLTPILPYLCQRVTYNLDCNRPCYSTNTRTVRAVVVRTITDDCEMLIDTTGQFFCASKIKDGLNDCGLGNKHYHGYVHANWVESPFGSLINGLSTMLKMAEEKRAAHLQSIRERSQLLDSIEKLLK
jgi:hypothetical protein